MEVHLIFTFQNISERLRQNSIEKKCDEQSNRYNKPCQPSFSGYFPNSNHGNVTSSITSLPSSQDCRNPRRLQYFPSTNLTPTPLQAYVSPPHLKLVFPTSHDKVDAESSIM
ncbi:hypothetical protein SLEP1_g27195 [Rubroshorea leprosula]|uniref:Uncharacterized protein n=1 Tax=Rubroshorea leprosula TaxID=152421 RepID=A0AAV5K0D4_9ROSI|nr:hypothetical protein SLEP1_g27195 [Rubroshorea leprosula]